MAEPFLGEIRMMGFNFNPRGWAMCDGQLLPIAQNTALFSLLGTIYGGDGRVTFALPDLRGRVPTHQGRGPGLSDYRIGSRGGAESVTLGIAEIPSHNHTATLHQENVAPNSGNGNNRKLANTSDNPIYTNDVSSTSDRTMHSSSIIVANTGGTQSHLNMQPFLTINFCIALVGLFPSRN